MALYPVHDLRIAYDDEKEKIKGFLSTFAGGDQQDLEYGLADLDLDDHEGVARMRNLKYMRQLQNIANRDQQMLIIDLEDVASFEKSDEELVRRIQDNTRRYVQLFSEIVDEILPVPTKDISEQDEVIDIILHQRTELNERTDQEGFPSHLLRRYNLFFKPMSSDKDVAIRGVKGAQLGKLISIRGIVTRVSEVKPLLLVNAYTCDSCGAETFQDVTSKQFTPLFDCQNEAGCKKNNIHGSLHMQTRACRFSPFQEVKVQEMADQVPVGHIPRSMTVHVHGGLTRQMNPGDVVQLGGIFLPVPYTGYQAVRAGLLTDTYLEAHYVNQLKKQYTDLEVTPEIVAELNALGRDPQLYSKLAQSIAPEIYGHTDVKKALLLLLVGGATKTMGDGMKIRGDINICLMGDPGVAKSQLLKYISKVAPRGVYTTGKGSSGVGLTAAVMRDPVTDEMILEGGALVLADNGICCIDEFDKMEESDRTAIHEVMEQQTISISKAGISTTLNARTSILAAANPLYGRYNPKVSPVENINLPAALLSRFDLLFLILDKPSRDEDERLAQHVTHVHMYNAPPELDYEPIDPLIVRHYIALARSKRPTVPQEVSNYIVESYVRLRKMSKEEEEKKQSHTYTSARTLLGVLRLSQALARLRTADEVEAGDVDEALRLMEVSKASLDDDEDDNMNSDKSAISQIYRLIKDMHRHGGVGRKPKRARRETQRGRKKFGKGPNGERDSDSDEDGSDDIPIVDIRTRVFANGFNELQLTNTILEYEKMDVWIRCANNTKLRIIEV